MSQKLMKYELEIDKIRVDCEVANYWTMLMLMLPKGVSEVNVT